MAAIVITPSFFWDIICGISGIEKPQKVHEIFCLNFSPFGNMDSFFENVKEIVDKNKYDEVVTSDLFSPFGNLIVHSHTLMYKSKNCKNIIEKIILSITKKKKINNFKKQFKNKNRKIFTVSNRLKQDYVENLGFEENNVICVYPGVDTRDKTKFKVQETFTFGIAAGNAINKGGYLFLLASFLMKLKGKKFKAKMIVSKSKKGSAIGAFLNLLKLNDKVEILPEQVSMDEFYKQIDCLVVPSVNEAFGLVVTEAASYGKPSIVSQTAGSAEILTGRINGFIFERKPCIIKSTLNLYKKMAEVAQLPKEEMEKISDSAFDLSQKFTWNEYCKGILKGLKLDE